MSESLAVVALFGCGKMSIVFNEPGSVRYTYSQWCADAGIRWTRARVACSCSRVARRKSKPLGRAISIRRTEKPWCLGHLTGVVANIATLVTGSTHIRRHRTVWLCIWKRRSKRLIFACETCTLRLPDVDGRRSSGGVVAAGLSEGGQVAVQEMARECSERHDAKVALRRRPSG
jgi:hypothetical protein